MGALEKPTEEDRIEALKQVAGGLPRPNLLLLRHLLYVLHLISKNAEVNKMDSSNLAICIGPNMLTLKNDQSLSFQAQKDLNNKVCPASVGETHWSQAHSLQKPSTEMLVV